MHPLIFGLGRLKMSTTEQLRFQGTTRVYSSTAAAKSVTEFARHEQRKPGHTSTDVISCIAHPANTDIQPLKATLFGVAKTFLTASIRLYFAYSSDSC